MSQLRLQLVLGKYPVVYVDDFKFRLKLGGTTEITMQRPDRSDIRDGDLLTLYTEVLLAKANN
jgi:hypothetical protein